MAPMGRRRKNVCNGGVGTRTIQLALGTLWPSLAFNDQPGTEAKNARLARSQGEYAMDSVIFVTEINEAETNKN